MIYADGCTTATRTYLARITSVTIPNSVTTIGSYAFYGCSGLTSVTIPNSVTTIGSGAFEGCSGLTSVTIQNSVTTIGSHAFYDCSGLTSVTIPNSVTTIGSYAFYDCSGLTSVTIPNSVTTIEEFAFLRCSNVKELIYADGCTTATRTYLASITSVTIPNSVTTIGSYAFKGCSGLTSVTIPNSVTTIGSYAFSDCSGLTSVTIPNSVTTIGEKTFSYCSNLTSVYTNSAVTFTGLTFKGLDVNNVVLYSTKNYYAGVARMNIDFRVLVLEDNETFVPVRLRNGMYVLMNINDSTLTFESNNDNAILYLNSQNFTSELKNNGKISIPFHPSEFHRDNNVDAIYITFNNDETFIADVTTPGNLARMIDISKIDTYKRIKVSGDLNGTDLLVIRKMGNLALLDMSDANIVNGGSSYYEQYTASENCFSDYLLNSKTSLIEVTLPKTIKSIKPYAFGYCTNLLNISIPANVTDISDNAFTECTSLQRLTIEDANTYINLHNYAFLHCPIKDVYIGRDCLYGKSLENKDDITDLYIGKNVRSVCSFKGCKSLCNVHIKDLSAWCNTKNLYDLMQANPNTKTIFVNENALTELVLPEDITEIAESAFAYTGIINSDMKNVNRIGDYAFKKCYSLQSITLGDSLFYVGHGSFYDCYNLGTIHLGTVSSWCNNLSNYEPIMCSSQNKTLYSNGERIESLIIPDDVTTIPDYAFYHTSISNVSISNQITKIGHSAFGHTNIQSISIPKSVKNIEDETFYGCTSLKEVFIEDCNEPINVGRDVWNKCELKYMYIGRNMNDKSSAHFHDAYIEYGDCVSEIPNYIFSYCKGIKSVKIGNNVHSIGANAFEYCEDLVDVDFPSAKQLKKIDQYAFKNCENLGDAILPEGLSTIGYEAFRECYSLLRLSIPSTIEKIDDYAFKKCSALGYVESHNPIPPEINRTVFEGIPYETCELLVPKESTVLYWLHPYWEKFVNMNALPENISGDVNGDGTVDVVDVTSIISCVLGDMPENFDKKAADINGDGEIDVTDITLAIEKSLQ